MHRQFVPVVHGACGDRPDERDTIATAEAVADALSRLGYRTEIVALDLDLRPLVALAACQPLIVFNVVEALIGDGAMADLPLAVMDHLRLRYTGAARHTYRIANSKAESKALLERHQLPTPAHWPRGHGVPADRRVIVKSVDEHGSLGIDAASVVMGHAAAAEVRRREARFGGTFFAEAFIEGREFNVALIETGDGPRVLPIQEIDLTGLPADQPRIVDYSAKWDPDSPAYGLTPRRFGLEAGEPALAAELSRLARACWRAFALTGYARVDVRVSTTGEPLILEVNANPCLAPDAGFAATAAAAGIGYDAMVASVVDAGLAGTAKERPC